jgi:hypothetical protein
MGVFKVQEKLNIICEFSNDQFQIGAWGSVLFKALRY